MGKNHQRLNQKSIVSVDVYMQTRAVHLRKQTSLLMTLIISNRSRLFIKYDEIEASKTTFRGEAGAYRMGYGCGEVVVLHH